MCIRDRCSICSFVEFVYYTLCLLEYLVSKSESEAMVSSLFVGAGFVYRNADCGCCLWIYIHAGNSPE